MLAILVALLVVYAWWAPTSWPGRLLNGAAEAMQRRLALIRPLTLVLFVVVLAGLVVLVACGDNDGRILGAMLGPEMFAWFATVDVGIAVEIAATAWLLTVKVGLRTVMPSLRAVRYAVSRAYRTGPRSRSRRTPRPVERADNDDDPAAATRRSILAEAA